MRTMYGTCILLLLGSARYYLSIVKDRPGRNDIRRLRRSIFAILYHLSSILSIPVLQVAH